MTPYKPRRSVLYMPGSNPGVLEKAKNLRADCFIFDLEDAVAPEAKESARTLIAEVIKKGGYGWRQVIIRINGLDTIWGEADMKMAAEVAPDAILVPKVSSYEDVAEASRLMVRQGVPEQTKLWAMMETAHAILNAPTIAAAASDPSMRLAAFVMGTNDLSKETRASIDNRREAMVPWLANCVAAARAYSLQIIDGVCNNFRDMNAYRDECLQGRNLGMDGKTLIHPTQISPCNEIFSPDPEDVAWSRKVLDVFQLPENKGKGATAIDGRLVELHHVEIARQIIAIAEAIEKTKNE